MAGHGRDGGPARGGRSGRAAGGRRREAKQPGGSPAGERSWVLGFVLRLLAGWAGAIVLLALVPGIERWAVTGTVGSVGGVLRLASFRPEFIGTTIHLGHAALNIIPECTPLMPALLLAIAMVSYPATVRWKLAGIGAGIVVLWTFNVVRMLALFATLVWWPDSFKFMHVYLWQSITLLVVSALFMTWLRFSPPVGTRA